MGSVTMKEAGQGLHDGLSGGDAMFNGSGRRSVNHFRNLRHLRERLGELTSQVRQVGEAMSELQRQIKQVTEIVPGQLRALEIEMGRVNGGTDQRDGGEVCESSGAEH